MSPTPYGLGVENQFKDNNTCEAENRWFSGSPLFGRLGAEASNAG
jgi:hypothetical protein